MKKEKNEINVPLSMLKKFLAANGMRVKPEAVKEFEQVFRNWANGVSVFVTKEAKEAKRMTILPEDFEGFGSDAIEEDSDGLKYDKNAER